MNFPVTVEILQPRKKGLGLEQGWLRDLGVDGARFYLSRSVPIGARIIRQMVRDLNFPIRVSVEPTVREPDGLAMCSRNRYLTPEQRAAAPGIYRALQNVRDRARAGYVACCLSSPTGPLWK